MKISKSILIKHNKLIQFVLILFLFLEFSCAPHYNPENGPLAYFKCNTTRAYMSTNIYFENLSKGSDIYIWDLGNGVISNEKNPQIKYSVPGTYKVTLYVKKGSKSNVYSREIEIVKPPVSYTITGIRIQQMPFFDRNSNAWDGALQGVYPDIYPVVLGSNNNILYSHPINQRKENLGPNMLPASFQFNQNSNLTFNEFDQSISIALFDFDSFSSDQKITTATPLFSINYFYQNAVTPESIILTGSNTIIYLYLTWQY
jgi:hypothetical protein